MERRLLEHHKVNKCINRRSQCIYCGAEVRDSALKVKLKHSIGGAKVLVCFYFEWANVACILLYMA